MPTLTIFFAKCIFKRQDQSMLFVKLKTTSSTKLSNTPEKKSHVYSFCQYNGEFADHCG